jgi:hypothetical protein
MTKLVTRNPATQDNALLPGQQHEAWGVGHPQAGLSGSWLIYAKLSWLLRVVLNLPMS